MRTGAVGSGAGQSGYEGLPSTEVRKMLPARSFAHDI